MYSVTDVCKLLNGEGFDDVRKNDVHRARTVGIMDRPHEFGNAWALDQTHVEQVREYLRQNRRRYRRTKAELEDAKAAAEKAPTPNEQ